MEQMKKKKGIYIWLGIGMILVVLIGGISAFYTIKDSLKQKDKEYVSIIDDTLLSNKQNIESLSIWNMKVETQKDVIDSYIKEVRSPLIRIGLICICSEIVLILILVFVMKQKQKKKLLYKMNQFSLQQEKVESEDELEKAMYECMKSNIDEKIKEYQGMNSYLAHEQKNLLGILYTKYSNQNDTQTIDILQKVNESIEDFLTLSDFSKETLEEIDVCMIAAEVCDYYSNICDGIEFIFDEDKSYEIMAKRRWIYRAISNLVDNAIKYGEGKTIRIILNNEQGSVLVKVEDHGCGIREEMIENIWGNRFREPGVKGDGYGIGLSLVSHVCDLCDGSYYVQSEEKVGSTFFLSFPEVNIE